MSKDDPPQKSKPSSVADLSAMKLRMQLEDTITSAVKGGRIQELTEVLKNLGYDLVERPNSKVSNI